MPYRNAATALQRYMYATLTRHEMLSRNRALNDILRALKAENVKAVLNGFEAAANNACVVQSCQQY